MKIRMTDVEKEAYVGFLRKADVVVEFGCGGSTALAVAEQVPALYSIESDRAWIEKCKASIPLDSSRTKATFIHADLGEVGAWGHPIGKISKQQAFSYHGLVWTSLSEKADARMAVLVDGRFRVACTLQAIANAPTGTIIAFHDYAPRPHYHVVEEVIDCLGLAGDMATFMITEDTDRSAASQLLERYFLESR